jgi:hypothetical protein
MVNTPTFEFGDVEGRARRAKSSDPPWVEDGRAHSAGRRPQETLPLCQRQILSAAASDQIQESGLVNLLQLNCKLVKGSFLINLEVKQLCFMFNEPTPNLS